MSIATGACEVDEGSSFQARLADLAVMRAELAEVEALQEEVRQRAARLRAVLPPEQFRLVWALLDAQERLGLAERLLAENRATELSDPRRSV